MKIAGSVDRVIPGHDPKVRSLYPSYNVGGIELTVLHEEPRPHEIDELANLDNFR
jgi:hypothetical protein